MIAKLQSYYLFGFPLDLLAVIFGFLVVLAVLLILFRKSEAR
ncbi:putative membrane protein [Paenibacillus eucommiae]|uniref:Membrane protein n=1 Tax=Paenibacillus eucommiae TaxID=1355755 RepID=A0ABS4J7V7_9BACL|nr:putative membrane protein [Paenibacillus eucommiae]